MDSQETHCITLLTDDFRMRDGSPQRYLCKLDELVRNRPAPDALLSDGHVTVAVEIKRLTFMGKKDLDALILVYGSNQHPLYDTPCMEVTSRGVIVTDIGVVTELTLDDASIKFRDANWADINVVVIHLSAVGQVYDDDWLTDEDYWDEEEFREALETANLPYPIHRLYGVIGDTIFLAQDLSARLWQVRNGQARLF